MSVTDRRIVVLCERDSKKKEKAAAKEESAKQREAKAAAAKATAVTVAAPLMVKLSTGELLCDVDSLSKSVRDGGLSSDQLKSIVRALDVGKLGSTKRENAQKVVEFYRTAELVDNGIEARATMREKMRVTLEVLKARLRQRRTHHEY